MKLWQRVLIVLGVSLAALWMMLTQASAYEFSTGGPMPQLEDFGPSVKVEQPTRVVCDGTLTVVWHHKSLLNVPYIDVVHKGKLRAYLLYALPEFYVIIDTDGDGDIDKIYSAPPEALRMLMSTAFGKCVEVQQTRSGA